MKSLRLLERSLYTLGSLLAVIAIVAVAVVISRPSQKSGSQPDFAGAEQQKKRLAIFFNGT